MILIPVPAEAGTVVIGTIVDDRCKRCCQDQLSPRSEETAEFIQRLGWFGQMLKDLTAENGIE